MDSMFKIAIQFFLLFLLLSKGDSLKRNSSFLDFVRL